NVREAFSAMMPMITPAFSSTTGMSFQIKSAAGEGILNGQGFTVTSLRVAQTFGIQASETDDPIADLPVNSLLNAWWTYREAVIRNPDLVNLNVELVRAGARLIKTYR